jgi:menaquinone-dependent protoporphyrinogen oxidase
MKVLVAYGSKRGGTAGLADMIGGELRRAGIEADVRPAHDVGSIHDVGAVVVVGALYASRWHRDARHFTRRYASQLRTLPVWLVSSGPLDDSAVDGAIPPVRQVDALLRRIGARGHVTFGGRLEVGARGFPARAMARKLTGDWRDPDHVHRWVASIAGELVRRDEAA